MYDVYFSYFDGNDHLCTNVDKIEIPTSSGIRTYSGDEIASQHFRIHSEIYLYSSSTTGTAQVTFRRMIPQLKNIVSSSVSYRNQNICFLIAVIFILIFLLCQE